MQTSNRKYGIDLLKIIAIFGVVLIHVNMGANLLDFNCINFQQFVPAYILETIFFPAVDIFAIISGYLLCTKTKFNSYRAFELISIVILYIVIFTAITYSYEKGDILEIVDSCIDRSWYIINYLPLFAVYPFINKLLNSLSIKNHLLLCCIIFFMFCILPTVLQRSIFGLANGYSAIWILACYIIGAYIRRADIKVKSKSKLITIIFISYILTICLNWFYFIATSNDIYYLLTYISPLIVIIAICSVLLFKDMELKLTPNRIKSTIKNVSRCTIDIYIIDTSYIVLNLLFNDKFTKTNSYNPFFIILFVLSSAIILFILFTIIALLRIKLFDILRTKKLFSTITKDKLSYTIE